MFDGFAGRIRRCNSLSAGAHLVMALTSGVTSRTRTRCHVALRGTLGRNVAPVRIGRVLCRTMTCTNVTGIESFVNLAGNVLLTHNMHLPLRKRSIISSRAHFSGKLRLRGSVFNRQVRRVRGDTPRGRGRVRHCLSTGYFKSCRAHDKLGIGAHRLIAFSVLISLNNYRSRMGKRVRKGIGMKGGGSALLTIIARLLPCVNCPHALGTVTYLGRIVPRGWGGDVPSSEQLGLVQSLAGTFLFHVFMIEGEVGSVGCK